MPTKTVAAQHNRMKAAPAAPRSEEPGGPLLHEGENATPPSPSRTMRFAVPPDKVLVMWWLGKSGHLAHNRTVSDAARLPFGSAGMSMRLATRSAAKSLDKQTAQAPSNTAGESPTTRAGLQSKNGKRSRSFQNRAAPANFLQVPALLDFGLQVVRRFCR